MTLCLIIVFLSIALMIASILFFPKLKIKKITLDSFWIWPLFGAVLLVILNKVSIKEISSEFLGDKSINPFKILILFFSMTFISTFLDELNFFSYLASKVIKKAKTSQIRLFIFLYLLTSILTVFTSNDIIILTFTPFIIFFCCNAKINPIPYLVGEFVAANTWSMFFIIGNPTNIYIATSSNLDFFSYAKTMVIPTIVAGLTSFLIILFLFKPSFKSPLLQSEVQQEDIKDPLLLIIALSVLSITTIMLVISSLLKIDMFLICFIGALLIIISSLLYLIKKPHSIFHLTNSLKRLPYSLIPFLLSMFVITLALNNAGVNKELANFLAKGNQILTYGLSSFAACSFIDNIPMSVLFSNIITYNNDNSLMVIYSTIIGSNLGAILTPIGALAGIMWMSLLRKNKVDYDFLKFMKYGLIISVPTILLTLLSLMIVL